MIVEEASNTLAGRPIPLLTLNRPDQLSGEKEAGSRRPRGYLSVANRCPSSGIPLWTCDLPARLDETWFTKRAWSPQELL